jgi:subtilisin family serine protease
LDLLLLPNWSSSGGTLAAMLLDRLADTDDPDARDDVLARTRLAHTPSAVAARLSYRELLCGALPLTQWWQHYLIEAGTPSLSERLRDPALRAALQEVVVAGLADEDSGKSDAPLEVGGARITGALLWLVRVAGVIARLPERCPNGLEEERDPAKVLEGLSKEHTELVGAFFDLLKDVTDPPEDQEPLWSVNINRRAETAIYKSNATVKADAARQVFDVTGKGIRWAIVDSGVDATHPAFRRRDMSGKAVSEPFELKPGSRTESDERSWINNTRVVATYDFTCLRDLVSTSPRRIKHLPERLRRRLEVQGLLETLPRAIEQQRSILSEEAPRDVRALDWDLWAPYLRVPHVGAPGFYEPPRNKHGTHVAGILAAHWDPNDEDNDKLVLRRDLPHKDQVRLGICPEIELYDLRVLDDAGASDEYSLMAALQFIRHINARHEHVEIHGANLSFSLLHEVSMYACGRTPICEECERLTAGGVTAVAAAGNYGRARYITDDAHVDEGYRTVSITDPGNAASVITVGSTHRSSPHTYGVSYFSSRGPTGDGRLKPDLVAPGEKITSTVPNGGEEPLDGTSMAAPHVSGAAALLMCRHAELIGRSSEIKRILCQTATDLGRERHFQGAGLLDILRALESV